MRTVILWNALSVEVFHETLDFSFLSATGMEIVDTNQRKKIREMSANFNLFCNNPVTQKLSVYMGELAQNLSEIAELNDITTNIIT